MWQLGSERIVGNPYLIALRQSRGDRAALAYAFVAVALKPVGTIKQMKWQRFHV
jgi:hypothetical protein